MDVHTWRVISKKTHRIPWSFIIPTGRHTQHMMLTVRRAVRQHSCRQKVEHNISITADLHVHTLWGDDNIIIHNV